MIRRVSSRRSSAPIPRRDPASIPNGQPISWDEAFEITARELKKTRDEDPRKLLPSIGYFHKEYLAAWPVVFGTHNIFSSLSNYCGGGYHSMNGLIHSTFSVANDVKYCNYWLSNGSGDGFSSHMQVAAQARSVADARVDRGMKVVTVEPRLSVAGAKAEEWVPIRPATDRFFALGLCHVMVNEKLFDVKFLKKDTNAPYLVGPDGYFMRNREGKVFVWDAADGKAKLWDDPTVKDYALEGTYECRGRDLQARIPVVQRHPERLHAGEDVHAHDGPGEDDPAHRPRAGAGRADRQPRSRSRGARSRCARRRIFIIAERRRTNTRP